MQLQTSNLGIQFLFDKIKVFNSEILQTKGY